MLVVALSVIGHVAGMGSLPVAILVHVLVLTVTLPFSFLPVQSIALCFAKGVHSATFARLGSHAPQVKTDSKGDVHYEVWRQPHNESTRLVNDEQEDEQGEEPQEQPRDVLTKPKILPVKIEWARIEEARPGMPQRYVLDAVTYQRLLDAVPK